MLRQTVEVKGCDERHLLGAALALSWRPAWPAYAMAQSEIKIGEINSYSLLPAFTEPYRKGWQLAVEEINAAGGINGKKLVVISKDDGGKPADAQTAANELVSSENVAMLDGHVPVQHRSRGQRLRQPEEGVLPRGRAADRRHHLVEGQPLHLPPASLQLHAGGDAGGSRRRSCRPSAGRRSRRTTNTASPRSRCSRS